RLGNERNERSKIDLLLVVEIPCDAGGQLQVLIHAALFLEPGPRLLVGGEDRARRTELGDHVRDRPALGVAERCHPGADELEHAAATSAHAAAAQGLQNDVLRLDPRALKLVLQVDADDLGTRKLERKSGRADSDVEAT